MRCQKNKNAGYLSFYFLASIFLMQAQQERPKVLHLTFHRGTENEFSAVARYFNFDLTTWFIPEFPDKFFDGVSPHGNHLYNIDHGLAERVWQKHKDFFNSFDAVITSDTAPLSRIFLQNNFTNPLIIWICNRFDYADTASLNGRRFPDKEYYQLFRDAQRKKNVKIVSYTPFEYVYAQSKGVDCGMLIIKPICDLTNILSSTTEIKTAIPVEIDKHETFFIPSYINDHKYNVQNICKTLGINAYCGRYNGPLDLVGFKGIIHLPYAWSNLALWENVQNGLIYFIPSIVFARKIPGYYFQDMSYFLKKEAGFSEWYNPENARLFVYFDSWADLKQKIATLDFEAKRKEVLDCAQNHKKTMIERWSHLFSELGIG
jgi:hypothetical protein